MKGFSGKEASLPSLLMQETQVLSPCWEDPLEKQMAAHSSTYPDSPMDREAGGLQSMGSQRVRHDLAT